MRLMGSLVAVALLAQPLVAAESREEQLFRHRNLGKAFYENSATQYEAVGEFKKALELAPDSARERVNYALSLLRAGKPEEGVAELEKAQKQDPTIPHTWFNLGIAYKNASRYDEAITQLENFVLLAPGEAIAHYNLGVLYKLTGKAEQALAAFERSAKLDPNLAGPHFQLATAYRQAKRADDAKKAMETFRTIKARDAEAAVPEDLEWSYYAEIYETIDPKQAADISPPAEWKLEPKTLAGGLDAATAGLITLDADGDAKIDLLAWSSKGAMLFLGGTKTAPSGLEKVAGIRAIAAGDADDDGLPELCVLTGDGAALWANRGGKLEKSAAALAKGSFAAAVWLDVDRDYDLDLILLGDRSAYLRNNGAAGWSDESASFPFVSGKARAGVVFDQIADTQGLDLAVTYADRAGVIYRDRLGGRYEAVELAKLPAGTTQLLARDVDNDGFTDLAAGSATGVALLLNDHKGGFRAAAAPAGSKTPLAWIDFENRGVAELAAGGQVLRNQGLGKLALGKVPTGLGSPAALLAADLDGDGKSDLAAVSAGGEAQLLRNVTATSNRWLRVAIVGVKNPKLAEGAEIEVKAGSKYQKQLYTGEPLVFGLGSYAEADAVRITWPNGLIQNESKQSAGQNASYQEAQRLSGSCPMIFTWNGEEYVFITDVLGVAPLGASAGNGEYFPVDHDEVVQIPAGALVARDGRYEVRVTEELREVSYLDEIRLIAVDHPGGQEIFTNDKFKSPPFPEFRLFGVAQRHHPIAARDGHGNDVREKLLARDQAYPNGYARNYAGVAELHHLELDFGDVAKNGRAILVLSGWVDWADGSTFLGAAQESPAGLIMPALEVKDEQGRWQTVIADMGIPAGKPKTIVVDLSGKFLSSSREVRITSNLCVYWDEIFLSEDVAAPETRLTDLHTASAELRFRGFSRVEVHPERKQPERFVYGEVRPASMWNPTPGRYTRFGEVGPLLRRVDDRFVIMGAGDELRLSFDAFVLPELPEGWRRDFLLFVDGWAKDGDANTAHSQTVGPLPYHGMPQYPYEPPAGYPEGEIHTLYQELYNTRPALRLIRPLTEGLGR